MNLLMNIYSDLFPHTGIADWFYAFAGVMLHVLLKIKNIPWEKLDWKVWIKHNLLGVIYTAITIVIMLGILPSVFANYNAVYSLFVGYSFNSMFKQLLKTRSTILK